jgi:phage-related protein
VAKVLGQTFQLLNNRGVFNDIEDAFESLIGPVSQVVTALANALLPILPPLLSVISQLAGVVQGVLVAAVQALAPVLVPVISLLGQLLQQAIMPLLPIITQFATVLGGILSQALKALLPSIGQLAIALLKILIAITPILPPVLKLAALLIELALKAVMPLIELVTVLAATVLTKLADVLAVVVGWIAKVIAAALNWIENFGKVKAAVSDVFDWIRSHWPLLLSILTGPIGAAAIYIITHWRQIYSGAVSMGSDVISFFRSLPGRILSALGDLGNLLFGAGERIVEGLINGVESMVGSLGHAMGSLLSEAKSYLPFSPAKKGPLSGGGAPVNSGRSIARQLAQGITAGASDVSAAMERVTRAATGGAGGLALAGAAGGGRLQVEIDLIMRGELLKLMQATVRHAGGDPAMFQKKVAYR